jgi:hypothetical protein
VLLALGSDQSDGSDPDLFVHPRAGRSAGRRIAIKEGGAPPRPTRRSA